MATAASLIHLMKFWSAGKNTCTCSETPGFQSQAKDSYTGLQLEETLEQTTGLQKALFTLERGTTEFRVPQFFSHAPQFPWLIGRRQKPSFGRFLGHVWCTPHTGLPMEVENMPNMPSRHQKQSVAVTGRTESGLKNKLIKFTIAQMQLICSTLCRPITKTLLQELFPTSAILKSQLKAAECSVPPFLLKILYWQKNHVTSFLLWCPSNASYNAKHFL